MLSIRGKDYRELGMAIRRILGSDSDFSRIKDSWNFSGLRIFILRVLEIFFIVFFKIKIFIKFYFFRIFTEAFLLFLAPTADIFYSSLNLT